MPTSPNGTLQSGSSARAKSTIVGVERLRREAAAYFAESRQPLATESTHSDACFSFRFHYIVCMDTVERATAALRQTETILRDLVSEATRSGDYASVVQVASWAKAVCELVGPRPVDRLSGTAQPSARKPVSRSDKTQNAYPRFYRRGDSVIRISKSKRRNGEYQHKAPHAVLLALADAMAEAGDDGRLFSTDEFLPIEVDGTTVPAYQAYLGIALLKQVGLIDQHGRQGYSIPKLAEFKGAVSAVWAKLPTQ